MENARYFRHWKGGLYKLVGIAKHSENLEEYVVYQSIKDGRMWVRPRRMFEDVLNIDGKDIPRFKEISESEIK